MEHEIADRWYAAVSQRLPIVKQLLHVDSVLFGLWHALELSEVFLRGGVSNSQRVRMVASDVRRSCLEIVMHIHNH